MHVYQLCLAGPFKYLSSKQLGYKCLALRLFGKIYDRFLQKTTMFVTCYYEMVSKYPNNKL